MIELPEAVNLARQLEQALATKRIAKVVAAQSKHGFAGYAGDPADYPSLLEGRTVERAEAHGGHVELFCGEARIKFNDGINIRYCAPQTPEPKKHQLFIGMDDGSFLYCTVSMYGGMMATLGPIEGSEYYDVARQKPSPLSDAFDRAYFDALWDSASPKLSAKAFLATEQRIPGLGNGVLHDILFCAGVHPKTKIASISVEERARLYDCVKNVLRDMAALGGRDTEKDIFGKSGGYHTCLSSLTRGQPCPRCGGEIVRQAYLGGNVYFCPVCQKQR